MDTWDASGRDAMGAVTDLGIGTGHSSVGDQQKARRPFTDVVHHGRW